MTLGRKVSTLNLLRAFVVLFEEPGGRRSDKKK
jgi:hypothetical protein